MFSRRQSGIAKFFVFVIGCGAAVAQTTQSASTAGAQAADFHSANTANPPTFQERHPRYQVMPSDILEVSFPLSTELNQIVTVQPDGFITLANLGSVYVQGQTTPQLVETLKKAYAKILHDPIIAVDLKNFQTPEYTIFGQVGRPGKYQLRRDTTISQAIAIGGGLLPSAKYQAFLLRRVSASSDWMEVKKLNVKALVHGKDLSEDIQLQPDDMVYVPEAFIASFKRYIPYSAISGTSPLGIAQTF
jgi:protein involved in polysaccharide export with SLBB domain